VTLKKDGIQTRNRKLSHKSKKKKSANMVDFFRSGLVDPRYGYGGGMMAAAAAAGMGHHPPSHHPGGGAMSGYYHQMAPMAAASSQFMQSGSMSGMSMTSMAASSPNAGGGGGSPGLVYLSTHGHVTPFSLSSSASMPATSMVAGAIA
jgi:hypothetical protein